jgi:cytidine deaminase
MKIEKLELSITRFENPEDAPQEYRKLLAHADKAMQGAYAPYSKFLVGAAILLEDDTIVLGSNQENASYPEGLCAERVAVFAAGAQFPELAPRAIALLTSKLTEDLVSPCGGCRQVMVQFENRHNTKMEVIMTNKQGHIIVLPCASTLLPWSFDGSILL